MELKDMILSTLAELEESNEEEKQVPKEKVVQKEEVKDSVEKKDDLTEEFIIEDERAFCENLRERVLVLFEGFQSPNNKSIEAKVDLTLNFLEYLLAVIDERLENLEKK